MSHQQIPEPVDPIPKFVIIVTQNLTIFRYKPYNSMPANIVITKSTSGSLAATEGPAQGPAAVSVAAESQGVIDDPHTPPAAGKTGAKPPVTDLTVSTPPRLSRSVVEQQQPPTPTKALASPPLLVASPAEPIQQSHRYAKGLKSSLRPTDSALLLLSSLYRLLASVTLYLLSNLIVAVAAFRRHLSERLQIRAVSTTPTQQTESMDLSTGISRKKIAIGRSESGPSAWFSSWALSAIQASDLVSRRLTHAALQDADAAVVSWESDDSPGGATVPGVHHRPALLQKHSPPSNHQVRPLKLYGVLLPISSSPTDQRMVSGPRRTTWGTTRPSKYATGELGLIPRHIS